ncbi:MAG: 23S rRNA (adenine(2503)-C(2))-methyltransferase RlmN [bacterium]|nr:23S rRNA (adenine(2503)-C(2))-methyltransferase RlmN [bacterium]
MSSPDERSSLLAYTSDELRQQFEERGLPGFRGQQVARWLCGRRVRDFDAMTNLSLPLRKQLAQIWRSSALRRADVHTAADGTCKLVLCTDDDARIESVIIPEQRRNTLCVSSQVGCSLDCSFCATGRLGLGRNLRAEEIVDQVLHGWEVLAERGEELSHVVFMGMGEPLLNLQNVVQAIRVLLDNQGLCFSPKRITVSTAGVVSRMADLGKAVPVRLAVSLHATTDEVRDTLVPINRRFPIAQLLQACRDFPVARRDRISFEYTLMRDVNDTPADAIRLAKLIRGVRCKVNVIPMNEHAGAPYRRPTEIRIHDFVESLAAQGVTATLRRARGDDIFAACGQLGALAADSVEGSEVVSKDQAPISDKDLLG